jgi:hypothetical protein
VKGQSAGKPVIGSDARRAALPWDSISHTWRALRHRNFKLFFFGQSISVIGTWMTRVVTTWLVYHLTTRRCCWGLSVLQGRLFRSCWGRLQACGAARFGSLLAGALAHRIGASLTVVVTGAFCIAGALWFSFHLPRIDAALQSKHSEAEEQIGRLPARGTGIVSGERELAS